MPGSEPDSGKPTVRDLRGACGNVGYGGIRNPPHIPKGCVTVTLRLRLRAPQFYPDSLNSHFCSDDPGTTCWYGAKEARVWIKV